MPENRVKQARLDRKAAKALKEQPVQRVPWEMLAQPVPKVRKAQPDPTERRVPRVQ